MVFGKTLESLRKRMDLELVTNHIRAKKLIAKPSALHCDIISDNLVSVTNQTPKIIIDRPSIWASVFWNCLKSQCTNSTTRRFCTSTAHVPNWPTLIPTHLSIIFKQMIYIKTWRTTGTGTIRCDRLFDRPSRRSDKRQGPRKDEERMFELVAANILWTSS